MLASVLRDTRYWRRHASAGRRTDAATRVAPDQRAPFHDDAAARLFVALLKTSNEIEARVVDEIELVEMHVKLATGWDLLERSGK